MAATKPPVFAGDQHIIERPRLTRMLDESKAKVILLLAPAGYGKTTLARQWLRDKPHVWYRASEADADVAALAVGLVTRAASLCPGADERIRQRMRAAADPEREAGDLADIVAEDFARLPHEAWIAVDDYQHVANSPACDLFMKLIVDSIDSRFLLTTRKRPNWATARNVVYGGTQIFAQSDLAMTERESEQVVRDASIGSALFREAMGWPAAIGLAARVGSTRLEGQPLVGDLYDFFAEELWRALPQDHQWLLIQLALFMPTPWTVAEDLFRDGAADLIRSELSAGWISREGHDVVIHPLLRRFLRARFEEFPSARRRATLKTIIEALTARQQWDQAMALAYEADENSVTNLFAHALDPLLDSGRLSTIDRWLDGAREQSIDAPILKLAGAEVAFRRAQYIRSESLGRAAADEFRDPLLRARSLNRAGMSATLLDHNELAVKLHREARNSASDNATLRDSIIGEIGAALDLGRTDLEPLMSHLPAGGSPIDLIRVAGTRLLVALRMGKIGDAVARSSALMPALADVRDPLARTSFLYVRATGLVAQAMYREALDTLSLLDDDAATFGIALARIPSKIVRAQAEAGLRNFSRARKLITDVLAETLRDGELFWFGAACGVQARIEAGSGSGVAPPHRPELAGLTAVGLYEAYLASLALAAASSGDRTSAQAYADQAAAGQTSAGTDVGIAWVRALLSREQRDATDAFDLSIDRGVIDYSIVAYRALPQLLPLLADTDGRREQLKAILIRANDRELFEQLHQRSSAGNHWRQRLTRREQEVYSLMVDGLSNRRIAQQLVITESTAKLHVRHVLEKLCARSRAEAVAKWRDVLGD